MSPFTTELIRICRYFDMFERDVVCCGNVSVPQCLVLQELLAGSRDNSGLAEFAGVSPSSMTRLVDGLERKGWVERVRSTEDRRKVIVRLNDAGREEAERLRRTTDQAVGAVLARIPPHRHMQVLGAMRLVHGAMAAVSKDLGGLLACKPAGNRPGVRDS